MKDKKKILLVEDDFNLGFVIQDLLTDEGYQVHLSKNGKEGLRQFHKYDYNLCILDVMLPKKDGFSLAGDIRKINQQVPIVFLTAKNLAQDKVKGFKTGADDYITKPFNTEEFLLRIKAVLKRTSGEQDEQKKCYRLGKIAFSPQEYELILPGEERKKLTQKESDLLKLFCQNSGKVLERELIANMVWGDDSYFVGRSMDVFITKLRKQFKNEPSVEIVNVHGVGFKLVVDNDCE